MSKISVNIENLEIAVANFAYASKEAEEINYRLKQLGNEFAEDIDLLASPEYETVMSCYTNALSSISRINEIFDSVLLAVIKAPEMYSNAESESVDKINALVNRSQNYQKAVTDDSALSEIVEKAENDYINIDGLADMVNKGYQSVNMSNLASEVIDIDDFEKAQTLSNDVADRVGFDFDNFTMSGDTMTSDENSDKEQ